MGQGTKVELLEQIRIAEAGPESPSMREVICEALDHWQGRMAPAPEDMGVPDTRAASPAELVCSAPTERGDRARSDQQRRRTA